MIANNMMDPMQLDYRNGHRTEMALLRVHNDIVSAVDKAHGVCLILLDLSAAFDNVDNSILLALLRENFGLDGFAIKLFEYYLTARTQCMYVEGVLSELNELVYGVPQGSVLGPIEFCIYKIPL